MYEGEDTNLIPDLSYKVESARPREPIDSYEQKQRIISSLRTHADSAGKTYPQAVWDYVEGPLFTSNSYGIIYDAPDGHRYFRYPNLSPAEAQDQSTQKPVLLVSNPVQFLDALHTFRAAVYSTSSSWNLSLTRGGLMHINPTELIWNNATEEDFRDPVSYLRREAEFLSDETFAHISTEWQPHGQIPILENRRVFLRRELSRMDYETPYLLQPALSSHSSAPEIPLPAIRYAINQEDQHKVAYLFGLQMPSWSQQPTADEIRQVRTEDQADMARDLKHIRTALSQQPDLFAAYINSFPAAVLDEQTDQVEAYWQLHQLLTDMGYSDKNNPFAQLFEKLEREAGDVRTPASRAAQSLNLMLTMSDVYKVKEAEYQLLLEKEHLRKQLNRLASGQASPQALLSATIFCQLLAQQGITELRIPTFLPLRVQMHERKLGEEQTEQTDGRMTWNLIAVAQQLEKDFEGLRIQAYPFEGDDSAGVLHLQLQPPISSDKPILQQTQAAIQITSYSK